jgi:dihydrofolate reductase
MVNGKRSTEFEGLVYVATSIDGFIARADGRIDWLPAPGAPELAADAVDGKPEDYGFTRFLAGVDAVLMGRNTYALTESFGTPPFGDKPLIVLTHRALTPPAAHGHRVEAMGGDVAEVAERLAARGLRRVYVDGGATIHQFIAAGLVRRIIVTRVPVLIGSGIPLFGALPRGDVHLRHVGTRTYPSGLEQSEYEVMGTERPRDSSDADDAGSG